MMKKFLLTGTFLLIPAVSFADNVGQCGWGSKLMQGNEGIAPQVLAVTTNGTSGNQTFGISSGTSGCTQDGVVRSNWKTAMFVHDNMNKLAKDISVGHGEALDSLANLLEMEKADKEIFASVLQSQFARIYARDDVSSQEVLASLNQVLTENAALSRYSKSL